MIVQEWDEITSHHRLKNTETGEKTRWAGYTQIATLGERVGYTCYYGAKEGVCSPLEFVSMIAVVKD